MGAYHDVCGAAPARAARHRGRKRAGGHWAFRMEGERAARVAAEQSEAKQAMFV